MSRLKELEEVYDSQLGDFMSNETYFEDYGDWDVQNGQVLIRFFVVKGKKSSLITPVNNLIGSSGPEMKEHQIKYPTNLAKVIKSGIDEIVPGQMVTLPYDEVAGVTENPKMKAYLEAMQTKGATPIKPLDTREFIDTLEYKHRRKMVIKPGNLIPDEEDRFTYRFNRSELELIRTA